MIKPVEDIINNLNTPSVLNTHFTQLINSLSGVRQLSGLGNCKLQREQLIDAMLQAIYEHFDAEVISLYLLEDDVLQCAARLNQERYDAEKPCSTHPDETHSLDQGLIGQTATSCQLTYIKNIDLEKNDFIASENDNNKPGTLICAPVQVNESVIGVLQLTHPTPNNFDGWQEHSVIIYAEMIGMLLHNHQLMTNMQAVLDSRTKELQLALEESEKLRARYEEMSIIDPLTKLYNRRYFFSEVTSGLARAKRYSQAFSLMLMDLDYFKEVNDKFGHECGDNVLKQLSEIFSRFTREGDTLARLGGEEFVMALPETNKNGAIKLAERIRSTIESTDWHCEGKSMEITISIGLSSLDIESTDSSVPTTDYIEIADIIREADRAMYYVKQHGRNNVKSFSDI